MSIGTVWIVMVDDGNVCCPGSEIEAVFADESAANSYASAKTGEEESVRKWSGKSRSVDCWTLGWK